MDVPSQEERVNFPFFSLFVLFRPSVDWRIPLPIQTHVRGISLLSLLNQIVIFAATRPTNTPRSKDLPGIWAFLSPVSLAREISHHR